MGTLLWEDRALDDEAQPLADLGIGAEATIKVRPPFFPLVTGDPVERLFPGMSRDDMVSLAGDDSVVPRCLWYSPNHFEVSWRDIDEEGSEFQVHLEASSSLPGQFNVFWQNVNPSECYGRNVIKADLQIGSDVQIVKLEFPNESENDSQSSWVN